MQLGIIGLGKMGAGIARRLLHRNHNVVVFDRNAKVTDTMAAPHAVTYTRAPWAPGILSKWSTTASSTA